MIKDRLDLIDQIKEEDVELLRSVEYQMKNHKWVPTSSIIDNSDFNPQDAEYRLDRVGKFGLVDGKQLAEKSYKVNRKGYDLLAIKELASRGSIDSLSNSKIGVGKEADVYSGIKDENHVAVKIYRIGRTSFTTVKLKRRGFGGEKQNWLYLSNLTASREYEALEALYPVVDVPSPIDQNRHMLITEVIDGIPMDDLKKINSELAEKAFKNVIMNIRKALDQGIIHSDLSKFNIFIKEDGEVILFDWPQYISIDHPEASYYLERDIKNVVNDFSDFDVERSTDKIISELKSDIDGSKI